MSNKFFSAAKFAIFLAIAISLTSTAGCKSLWQNDSQKSSTDNTAIQPVPPPPPAVLADGSRTSYADIVDRVAPAVVKVSVEHKNKISQQQQQQFPFGEDFFKNSPLNPRGSQRPPVERGLGSGVIVSADGTILTNQHVIEGADKIKIEMTDKRVFDAKVVGSDKPSDLAVLKIDANNLPYLNLGNSDQVRVGDIVLAIGNPLGIGQTVTAGIISAKGRRTGLSDGSFEDFLQTDAPINHGNSGGALINLNGELIGINSQILSGSPTGGNIGIGFSIPSNMAKPVMEQILQNGKVRRGQLGVVIQPITEEIAKTLQIGDTKGVIVSEVKPGSAADNAGIKRGDVITSINGEKVDDSNVLRNKIASILPGSEVTLSVSSGGSERELKVKLDELNPEVAAQENQPKRGNSDNSQENGRLGLDLQPLTPELTRQLNLPADSKGLVVTEVDPAGPAADAGIDKGDVILEINRQPVENIEQAKNALDKVPTGASLILIARGGRTVFVTVQPN